MPSIRINSQTACALLSLLVAGCSGFAPNTFGAVSNQPPNAPVSLRAFVLSEFDIKLSWKDRSANESGFGIERAAKGEAFHLIAQLPPSTTTFLDHDLVPATQYRYRVYAYNSFGTSAFSNLEEARTLAPPCPLAVIEWGYAPLTPLTGLKDIVAIADGETHTVALRSNGKVVSWGNDSYGQTDVPTNLNSVVAISAGFVHSLALKSDGTVVAWGNNGSGQSAPPANLVDVAAIAAGDYHSLALTRHGTVVGWGSPYTYAATPPTNLTSIIAIAAGANHSLALRADGTVVGWGDNSYGQSTPPANLTDVVAIAAGGDHSLALKRNGTVVAWGFDYSAILTPPPHLNGIVAIAAGRYDSFALKSDGSVVGWGSNSYATEIVPQGLSGVVAIAAYGSRYSVLSTAPAMPQNASARISSSRGINVSWTDASGNETAFKIERAIGDFVFDLTPWQLIATVKAGITNYLDRDIASNFTYWYRISAPGKCSESPYSPPAMVTVAPPYQPFELSAVMGLSGHVNLSWRDYVADIKGFKIERAPDVDGSPGTWKEVAKTTDVESYADPVPGSASYWYRVRAFNVLGASPYSDPVSVQVSAPYAPLLNVRPFADKALLSWAEPYGVFDVENFKLERALDSGGVPGDWTLLATITNVNTYEFTDTHLALNGIYWYRISAGNWVGDSPPSDEKFVIISGLPAPLDLKAVVGVSNSVDLQWETTSNDQDGFKVERATDYAGAPSTWSEIASLNLSNVYYATYSDSTVSANTTNWYRVRSFNTLGYSPYCTPVSVKLTPPDAPLLSGSQFLDRIELYWSDSTAGSLGYRLYRAWDISGAPGPWMRMLLLDPPSGFQGYYDFQINPYTTYWYRIQAFNWIGDSPYSAPVPVAIGFIPQPFVIPSPLSRTVTTNDASAFQRAASTPRLVSVGRSNDDLIITWNATGPATNLLQAAERLTGPFWDISPPIPVAATSLDSVIYMDKSAATNTSPRFYRVRIIP